MVYDEKLEIEVLCGNCNKAGLLAGEFQEHFTQYYEAYHPDSLVTGWLKNNWNGVSVTIVLGTWCSDSQEQVPAFYNVLDRSGFDTSSLNLICVKRSKEGHILAVARMCPS